MEQTPDGGENLSPSVLGISRRESKALHELPFLLPRNLNIDEMGVIYDALTDATLSDWFRGLSSEVVLEFVKKYLGLCMALDPNSEWADSRYSAAAEVRRLLTGSEKDVALRMELWLTSLYGNARSDVRLALETACFEHLPRTGEFKRLIKRVTAQK